MKTLFFSLLLFVTALTYAATPEFTPEEQAWIKQHPVVYYTFPNAWPVDYMDSGQHIGLGRDFLNIITQNSGLIFIASVADENGDYDHPPEMKTVAFPLLSSPEASKGWIFTRPYIKAVASVVTKTGAAAIFDFHQLEGKTVAVNATSPFNVWMEKHIQGIKLVSYQNTLSALSDVLTGKADAYVGSDLAVKLIIRTYYPDRLEINGVLPNDDADASVAIKDTYPELQSIMNKSIESISGAQISAAYLKWQKSLHVDLGTPTLGAIFYFYRTEIIAFALLFMLLLLALNTAFRSRQRAKRSEAEKGRFLAVMSHEIRTPMNGLIASLELMQQPGEAHKQQNYLKMAQSSAQHLLELVNNILDFSQLESAQMRIKLNPVVIEPVIRAVCEMHQASAHNKSLALRCEMAPEIINMAILTDAQRVGQILHNLIANAIKFTTEGEVVVKVSSHLVQHDLVQLLIAVSDTGPGITPELQKKLFQAWAQGRSSQTASLRGSGLGLFISQQLAGMMNGALTLQSEYGTGSTFLLSLPVALQQAVPPSEAAAPPALPRFSADTRVLVVEDHPVNQALIRAQLEQMGISVEIAADASSAITLLEEENYYDLALIDCQLPDKDGYDLAREIRALEQAQQRDAMPMIAISARNDREHLQRVSSSGMNESLSKPIQIAPLAARLQAWCAATTSDLSAEVTTPEVSESIAYLEEDLSGFRQAAERADTRVMIHHVHRLRGVALMHNMQQLAEKAEQLETVLREAGELNQDKALAASHMLRHALQQDLAQRH